MNRRDILRAADTRNLCAVACHRQLQVARKVSIDQGDARAGIQREVIGALSVNRDWHQNHRGSATTAQNLHRSRLATARRHAARIGGKSIVVPARCRASGQATRADGQRQGAERGHNREQPRARG